jgi:hypothetical protein
MTRWILAVALGVAFGAVAVSFEKLRCPDPEVHVERCVPGHSPTINTEPEPPKGDLVWCDDSGHWVLAKGAH